MLVKASSVLSHPSSRSSSTTPLKPMASRTHISSAMREAALGNLYSRVNGIETAPARVYWQGPSIGADVGATGSHTLFLVYNLDDVKTLYKRFGGIDGAAYVAGGFGLTVYRSGDTLIVPIRTGLGLRLGASIAYLKFTERASLNPF